MGGLTLDFRPTLPVVIKNNFLSKFAFLGGKGRMVGTLGGLWIALKIGVYFLIMKISNNPLQEVAASQNRSSSHPTLQSKCS